MGFLSVTRLCDADTTGLSGNELRVMLRLCHAMNELTGDCFPTTERLVKETGLSRSAIFRTLADLEKGSWITRTKRASTSSATGERLPSQYALHYPKSHHTGTLGADQNPTLGETLGEAKIPADGTLDQAAADTQSPTFDPPKVPLAGTGTRKSTGKISQKTSSSSISAREPPSVPDWIPQDAWQGFVAMRAQKGKPPTERAVEIIVGKLDRWRASGHDPGVVLDTSTENGWTGIFEPKERQANGRRQDRRDGAAKAIDDFLATEEPARPAQRRLAFGGGGDSR